MNLELITLIGVAVTVIVAVAGGLWGIVKYLREFGKEFRTEMQALKTEVQALRAEIQALRTELKEDIQSVRNGPKGEIQSIRTEMKDEFRSIRTELKTESARLENRITHIDQKLDFIGYGYDFTQTPPKKLRTRRLVKTDE